MALITTIVDPYNHERFIEQALVSVLEQGFSPAELEVIVVDDGSTDRTAEIASKFEPRVRLIRKQNGGQASAYNAGVAEGHGEIIAFLDGDDWWAKNKLRAVVETFEANPDIAAVGHGYYEVQDNEPAEAFIAPESPCLLNLSSVENARIAARAISLLGSSRLSVRRQMLRRMGPVPERLIFCADVPVIAAALALGGAIVLEQPLTYYRIHAGSASMHDASNSERVRRYVAVSDVFLKCVPEMLMSFGVAREISTTLLESNRVEVQRAKAQIGEGGRWDVFRAERDRFRVHYQNPSVGYRLFQSAVSACALLLPPRRFYELLAWYERNDVKRFRSLFGRAEPAVSPSLFARRTATNRELPDKTLNQSA